LLEFLKLSKIALIDELELLSVKKNLSLTNILNVYKETASNVSESSILILYVLAASRKVGLIV
jgi:hypothetical protein